MSINQRQFDKLKEMGISLWQHKSNTLLTDTTIEQSLTDHSKKVNKPFEMNNDKTLSELIKQTLFTDILQSVDISIGEVNHKEDHLDLGLFNWFFLNPKESDQIIYCKNNNLYSPNLTSISQSPALKKQLWQTINQHLL